MDFAIVDLQGFKDDWNNFIVKELSFLTQNIKFSDVIKSPYEFDKLSSRSQKVARWLIDNYHGVDWNDGYISVTELRKTILPILKNKIIYVKGEEKIHWLRDILDEKNKENLLIVNIEIIGCDLTLHNDVIVRSNEMSSEINDIDEAKKKELSVCCHKHRSKPLTMNCSLRNAAKLKKWYALYCKKK